MAQPKRRWSKARTHSKRSTWKKEQYYDGKEVIAKKEAENA